MFAIFYPILCFALSLRYRITLKGFEEISKLSKSKKGILFLANHPAEIDPGILIKILWKHFQPKPVALGSLFKKPLLGSLLNTIGAIPVPDFENSSNSFKRKLIEKSYKKIIQTLRNRQNVLIYPSGGLKHQSEELVGGASATHQILSSYNDVNIVLIRTTGLWGSIFSRAITGKSPDLEKTFLKGFKILLKNLLFFAPRRQVTVEFSSAPSDFPFNSSKMELNRYLEGWFNKSGPEPINLVSYYFFKNEIPSLYKPPQREGFFSSNIPLSIQHAVKEEVGSLARISPDEIVPELELAKDLGLDSLDFAQIVLFLKDQFEISQIHSTDLTTVGSVMAFAAGIKEGRKEDETDSVNKKLWDKETSRPSIEKPNGKTILEAFFNVCQRMKGHHACIDMQSDEISYDRMKLAVIALSQKIKELPGSRIGIMLPASTGVNIIILATLLAKKVPVMVNWTLGPRNLESIISQADINVTLTSWNFIDKLENVDLDGVDSQLVFVEDLRAEISLKDKWEAWILSKKSAKALIKRFNVDTISEEDPAVILFTSGTESTPKGVPLSNKNILSNQSAALDLINIESDDVMLGVLPPFHSFGFSVTGMLPLLIGLKVAFSPNPTDGRRVAQAIARWNISIICLAPTFLKTLLRIATADQMRSVKLIVTGAEKTPQELFDKVHELDLKIKMIEGYGITECGPILTCNNVKEIHCGVGKPLQSVELLIIHPETHAILNKNEIGLICAIGPNIFKGYLKSQSLKSPFIKIADREWYNTGDLGYLNDQGYLILVGRLKRFVKIGGEMISLAAIEESLHSFAKKNQWPLKEDTSNFAVSTYESGKKAELILFTPLKIELEEINCALRKEGLSNLARISYIVYLDKIPVLGTGKIDYKRLTQMSNDAMIADAGHI